MTPQERDAILARIRAVWPTPKMPDETVAVWCEHLGPLDYERLAAAVRKLERTAARRPSLPDLHEAYAAERRGPVGRGPACAVCDDGWVAARCGMCDCADEWTRDGRCPRGYRTLARCPNGCRPRSAEEREARHRHDDDTWRRAGRPVDPSVSRREQQEAFTDEF